MDSPQIYATSGYRLSLRRLRGLAIRRVTTAGDTGQSICVDSVFKEMFMKIVSILSLSLALLPVAVSAQSVVPAAGGNITITPVPARGRCSSSIGGKVIQVDPAQGDLSKAKPGDWC